MSDLAIFARCFLIGLLGATCIELIKLWEGKGKLTDAKFKKIIRSLKFWLLLAGFLFAAGVITWAFNADAELQPKVRELFMTGAAAGAFLRQGATAAAANRAETAGGDDRALELGDLLY